MATGKALNGKPYAGNPHVRCDEGEVASAATSRRGSLLYNSTLFATIAAVAASAVMSAMADTYKDRYGLTWTYTVTSGTDVKLTAVDDKKAIFAASNIPWTFTNNDTDYTVTAIGGSLCSGWTTLSGPLTIPAAVKTMGSNAFDGCKGLTGLTIEEGLTSLPYTRTFYSCEGLSGPLIIPHSVEYIGRQTFLWLGEHLTSVWFKGPNAVASGEQPYTTLDYYSGNILYPHDKLGLKVALFGLYTKPGEDSSNLILRALTGCILYLPRNGYWLEEKLDSYFSGTMSLLYYGAGEELDISINEAENIISATPTTVNALTNVLKSVAVFKSDFGLDTKISVTNAIDMSGMTITDEMSAALKFDSLVFSVKTQAQLNDLLSAFPENVPFAIDPTGLAEDMVVPNNREVFVKAGVGYDVIKLKSGFVLIVM